MNCIQTNTMQKETLEAYFLRTDFSKKKSVLANWEINKDMVQKVIYLSLISYKLMVEIRL